MLVIGPPLVQPVNLGSEDPPLMTVAIIVASVMLAVDFALQHNRGPACGSHTVTVDTDL